jgi:hypothetical protein
LSRRRTSASFVIGASFNNPDTNINDGAPVGNSTTLFTTGANSTGANNGFGSINSIRLNSERQLELAAHINF